MSSERKHDLDLDQFYTEDSVACSCVRHLAAALAGAVDLLCVPVVEPSAGGGAFVRALGRHGVASALLTAVDIDPRDPHVERADFLAAPAPESSVFVGNPPFGRRGSLALRFMSHAMASDALAVAFILPVQFRKWGLQKEIPARYALVHDSLLAPESFVVDGRPYAVRCCFQVWLRRDLAVCAKDMRIRERPATAHPDFEMFLYNNTPEARKVFGRAFDFAVPRQGFQDYSRRETRAEDCELSKQWLLFKAGSAAVGRRLRALDFEALSKLNTSTPGFGKADVVQAYAARYGGLA